MIAFYCDLDNTLIYSHKKDIGKDCVAVESYLGKEISFMSISSATMLKQIKEQVIFIPTTTRTKEQYNRVNLGKTPPQYALVCNGGILLRQGVVDEDWYNQSKELVAPCKNELESAKLLLSEDENRCLEVHYLSDLFLFTKSNDPQKTINALKAKLDNTKVDVFYHGAKIYVLPINLTKAHAVIRLNKMLGEVFTISAGDSPMDAPMLKITNIAFAPNQLAQNLKTYNNITAIPDELIFSDEFLQQILANFCNKKAVHT